MFGRSVLRFPTNFESRNLTPCFVLPKQGNENNLFPPTETEPTFAQFTVHMNMFDLYNYLLHKIVFNN